MSKEKLDFKWWAGPDDELYTIGPCDDREQAFQEGQDSDSAEGFYIVEAAQASNLRLALQFEAEDFLGSVQDNDLDQYSDLNGENVFNMDVQQMDRMQAAVRAAIEAWQTKENLTFKSHMLQDLRNGEFILPIDVDEQGDPSDMQTTNGEASA